MSVMYLGCTRPARKVRYKVLLRAWRELGASLNLKGMDLKHAGALLNLGSLAAHVAGHFLSAL